MNSEPPFLSYRGTVGAEGTERGREGETEKEKGKGPSPYAEVLDKGFIVLTWVILTIVLVIWAVVGVVFWIPLLLRAMLRFSISLIEAMFEGHKPTAAAKVLRDAVSFYRRGFVVAVEVVTREQIDRRDEGPVTEHRLLMEVLWALLVWYFIFLFFGWIQASPLDLVDWFFSIPWAEYFGDLVQRFRV